MSTITHTETGDSNEIAVEGIGDSGGLGDQGTGNFQFPINSIPGIAGEMAKEVARVSICRSEPLAASCVLGVVSAAIGAALEVESGPSRRTRGNLFILAAAESGTGKTEIFNHIASPLDALEAAAMAEWRENEEPSLVARAAACKARADRLTRLAANTEDPANRRTHEDALRNIEIESAEISRRLSSRPQFRVSDITKEKLAELMHGQPAEAMSSMSSEARGIISILEGRYSSGGDGDLYCAGFSGDSVQVDRVKNQGRIVLRKPCLAILWMMQNDIVERAFASATMSESGFLPRFITFDSQAQPHERDGELSPILDDVKEGWKRRVEELARLRSTGETTLIQVSPGANDVFLAFENECIRRRRQGGDLARHASFVGRWAENAWRLGVVLHAAVHGSESARVDLSQDTAESAVRLMRWFASRQLEFLCHAKRHQISRRFNRLIDILATKGGTITLNVLEKHHGFRGSEVRDIASRFPGHLSIAIVQSPGGGRPSTLVSLTPNPQNPR